MRGVLKKELAQHLRPAGLMRRSKKNAASIRALRIEAECRMVPGHRKRDLLVGSGKCVADPVSDTG
jgi:hypothetical protein